MKEKTGKGFTIIEVVLVLAIGGLIFLMVFVALPSLQRNQRDTQRKDDLSRALTAVQNYTSNNNGALPGTTNAAWNNTFLNNYLKAGDDSFVDPSGTAYSFSLNTMTTSASFDANSPVIYVSIGAKCDGENITTGQGARKVALRMKLEGGGISCVNN